MEPLRDFITGTPYPLQEILRGETDLLIPGSPLQGCSLSFVEYC
ncbi:MAG: hypothetical protein AVDCRST_MAG25-3232 [uncultured Rubrobacteraceae bacterium]|uniref:Uncharacterized protein n=1 Tax=uncultured Rubrobacteraceae bacterium TaxID=349277 RepID=A0A6J4SC42_9ACTN|nr:MAG: hypothetical protein AVDCRST_MAG25-3232 [uncultured Rubrobacteraceae bacterium]